jgi:CelD/BcsL family acetyltransferase involved in cellulose biosynthesis
MSEATANAGTRIEREIEPLAEAWDALADRTEAPPFARPGWFSAWWGAFGRGSLELVTLRRGGRLVAVLPLARRRGALRALANYHSPAFSPAAEDTRALQEVAEAAVAGKPCQLALPFVERAGPALGAVRDAAATADFRVLERTLLRTPVVAIEGDWESYLASLSRKFRKELRRHRRQLDSEHQVGLEIVDEPGEVASRLEEAFELEGSGWKASAGTAIASQPQTRRFYEEVMGWAAARGMLRLCFLRVDRRPIAVDIALEDHGVRYLLKGGFDPAWARFSPGTLLLEAGLEEAFTAGLTTVEIGGGEDSYKLRWTADVRERALLQAFPSNPFGLAGWATYAHARPLAARMLRRTRTRSTPG